MSNHKRECIKVNGDRSKLYHVYVFTILIIQQEHPPRLQRNKRRGILMGTDVLLLIMVLLDDLLCPIQYNVLDNVLGGGEDFFAG